MGKATLKGNTQGSDGTILRSDKMEVGRLHYRRGEGSDLHSHPEEQTVYVEQGRLEVTLGQGEGAESYVVEAGQASFHGADVPHRLAALEDTWVVSFKNLVDSLQHQDAGRLQ